jgi:hypothetical protein
MTAQQLESLQFIHIVHVALAILRNLPFGRPHACLECFEQIPPLNQVLSD